LNRVNIQPQASAEAEEAAAWYENQRPGLGAEFVLELDAAIERAAKNPNIYVILYQTARRVLLHRFPYAVYFVHESSVIEVFAILHQQRNQLVWQKRAR